MWAGVWLVLVVGPAGSLVGSAGGVGLVLLGTAVPMSGLAPPDQPDLHLSCSPGCFSSPGDALAVQVLHRLSGVLVALALQWLCGPWKVLPAL